MVEDYGADDLEPFWERAVEEYKKKTGQDFKSLPTISLDRMEQELSEKFSGSESKGEILKQTLKRLFQLSELALDSVSQAFPPAAVCYKAAQSMVDIAAHYKAYYTARSVEETLNTVSPHFERVERYVEYARQGARLDYTLVKTIFQLLRHFLNICTIYSGIVQSSKRKRGKFQNFCKAFIGMDGGIQTELAEINKLVLRELHQNVADTRGAFLVKEGSRIRSQNNIAIRDALKIDENDPLKKFWSEAQKDYRNKYVPGIGSWLLKDEEFSAWADVQTDTNPVLALEVNKGFGKTYLCSEVIESLLTRYKSTGRAPGALVAFFYFKSTEKGQSLKKDKDATTNQKTASGADDARMPIQNALKAIIWQLALSDENYQRFLADRLKQWSPSEKANELWDKLIMDYFKGNKDHRCRKPIYIVIDAVEAACDTTRKVGLKYIIQRLTDPPNGTPPIRIFLTGTKETFKTGFENGSLEKLNFIRADGKNREDIHKFIRFKLDRIAQSLVNEEEQKTIQKLEKRLCEQANGDFLPTVSGVDEIRQASSNNDLREILARDPASDYSASIPWHMKRLEASLTDSQIEEFNDVLLCVVVMRVWPSVQQLTTFLWLRDEKRNPRELAKRMKEDFFRFFEDTENDIVWSPGTMRYFEQPRHPTPAPSSTVLKRDAKTGCIGRPEVALIRNFAKMLCGDDMMKDFDELVNNLPEQRSSIGFEPVDAHVKIVLCLLRAFRPDKRLHSDHLHSYAGEYLVYHLEQIQQAQLNGVDESVREEIGQLLYDFFLNEEYVKTWMTEKHVGYAWGTWEEWQKSLDHVLRWLKDASVANGARKAAEANLRNAGSERTDGQEEALEVDPVKDLNTKKLLHVSQKVLAHQWLESHEWDAKYAFKQLQKLSEVLGNLPQPCQKFLDDTSKRAIVAFADWAGAESWEARSVCNTRVAETVDVTSDDAYRFVVERCNTALDIEEQNWRASWCLAKAHKKNRKPRKAAKEMEYLLEKLQDKELRDKHPMEWEEILDSLLDSYESLSQTNKAIKAFGDLSEAFPDDMRLVEKGINWVKDNGEAIYFRKLLHALSASQNADGRSPVAALLLSRAESPEFHHEIATVLQDDNGLIVKIYDDATKPQQGQDDYSKRCHLRFWYGMALYYQQRTREAVIVWESEESEPANKNLEWSQVQAKTAEKLASCYIELTKASEDFSEKRSYVKKMRELKCGADRTLGTCIHYLTLSLSRIYMLTQQEEMAISCVRDYIGVAVKILTDPTYDNDCQGYMMLSEAFIALGKDEDRATTAWSMINPGDDGHRFDTPIICDGGCGHTWRTHPNEEIWICRDCCHVRLDKVCHDKLQREKLTHRICGKGHEFFRVPKWDGQVRKQLKSRINNAGGVEKMIEEWLDDIKSDYGIKKTDLRVQDGSWSILRSLTRNLPSGVYNQLLNSGKRVTKAGKAVAGKP